MRPEGVLPVVACVFFSFIVGTLIAFTAAEIVRSTAPQCGTDADCTAPPCIRGTCHKGFRTACVFTNQPKGWPCGDGVCVDGECIL